MTHYLLSKPNEEYKILIVDDEEQILTLLESFLVSQGYKVIKANNGVDAIKAAEDSLPDLVLLDVLMPGIDGLEVCRRLKRGSGYLPVIMITALGDRDSRITGIGCGANDFLSKPLDLMELKLKVENFLRMKDYYDGLQESYQKLLELEKLKGNLIDFIIHDLRYPVTSIKGYLDLLGKSKGLRKQDLSDVNKAKQNVDLLMTMIFNFLDIKNMESGEMKITPEACDLWRIVASAVRVLKPLLEEQELGLVDETQSVNMRVMVQRDLIERVVQNILHNAIRYTPKGGKIRITGEPAYQPDYIVVSISDTGKGILEEHRELIFDKFRTVDMELSGGRRSTGLGLAFCKLTIELHSGKIWVEDREGGGTTFKFTLPLV